MTVIGLLKGILYVLLGLFLLLLLLLCIPAFHVTVYRSGQPVQSYVRWLFLKFDLTQMLAAQEQESKPAPEASGQKKEKKPSPKTAQKTPMEFSELLGMILDLLSSAKGGAGVIVRHFRIHKLRLHMVVAEDDAAETAIAYGRMNAMVYSSYALAASFLNLAKPDILISPDFTAAEGSVDFEVRGRLFPIVAVAAVLRIGCVFIVKTMKRRLLQDTADDKGHGKKRLRSTKRKQTV